MVCCYNKLGIRLNMPLNTKGYCIFSTGAYAEVIKPHFIDAQHSRILYLTLIAYRHSLQVERCSGLHWYAYAKEIQTLVCAQEVDSNV